MYLLDTNVLSEMRKASRMKESSPRMDGRVEKWVASASPSDLHLSVVSILELERGFHLLRRRDPAQAELILLWVRNGLLSIPNPIDYRNSLIAATALVRGLTVVTRNIRHFEPTGVGLLNPWED